MQQIVFNLNVTLELAMIDTETPSKEKWQERLLPFMSRTIVLLSTFFFLASLAQSIYLHYVISHRPEFDTHEAINLLKVAPDASQEQVLAATRMKSLIMLESYALDDQYHQANVLLMGRLWTSYIGFVTGMILALVGATFILGKLNEAPSEVTSKTVAADLSIKSSSPGLILAFLGTILMVTAIVTHHEIEVKHNAIYIHDVQTILDNNDFPPPLPAPRHTVIDSTP
jgi:hypothetical protein